MSRRHFLLQFGAGSAALGLLAACGGGEAPGGVANQSTTTSLNTPQTISAPAATSSSASATSGLSSARGEAKGKLTYAWHTSISPAWLDPQENPPQITPYNFCYAVHDALVKHMPGKPFAPSLAESYEIARDFKTATFKLRPGITFHDGSPITPEDVKFTFEQYRGANAKVLHDKTEGVEIVDKSTIRFHFKQPFLDFLTIYGSPSSGAGWVVPRAYYEKVGPNGFKTKPVGAGPYKVVRQQQGTEVELEAFTGYWRKVPNVKTIVMKGVTEGSTRVAMLQTGEADISNLIPGELLETVKRDPKLQLAAVKAGPNWIELFRLDRPESPLKDVRVRQAVSLAIDRKAINDAEQGGLGLFEGNWIPQDWPGAIERPAWPFDLARAKQLLAEAGVPNGFDVESITPLPPYFSWAERVASQLRAVNIRVKVNTMERGAFYERLTPGPNRLKGMVLQFSGSPGDAAARVRENATCEGTFSGICTPEVEDRMKKYDASTDAAERKKLLDEVQAWLLDQYYMVPLVCQALIHGIGPRIANKIADIEGAIPQYVYTGPWEDLALKE